MSDTCPQEIKYWLALLHVKGLGPRKLTKLLQYYRTPSQIFAARAELDQLTYLSEPIKHAIRHPNWQHIDQDIAWLEHEHRHLITLSDGRYPPLLRQIADPPAALFVEGNPDVLCLPQLAIVGSRNPSQHGVEIAFTFAQHLSQSGLVITSGLAKGIDAASHRGALAASGLTVAVFGSGLDNIYPSHHRDLAAQIAAQGALVSEYLPGSMPFAHRFPQRNRIISGLSVGTLVVEAALKSGSLITAHFAAEQNREVFAIPGSIHNALAKGCHYLLKNGAKLVETSQDIWDEIPALINFMTAHDRMPVDPKNDPVSLLTNLTKPLIYEEVSPAKLDSQDELVMAKLGYEPTSIDSLVERCQLTAETISSILVQLEIFGRVTSIGGLYSRVHN